MITTRPQNPESWYQLRLFNYLRGSIALFFIVIDLNGWLFQLVNNFNLNADLFLIVSAIYFSVSILFGILLFRQKPALDTQVMIQALVDIACIVVMMHALGSIRTGLGTLLIINISMTSLFLPRKLTILFAAIAALGILAEQVVAQILFSYYAPAFTQAGLLGVLIFISAMIASYLAEQLKATEKLAKEKSQELESITQMNEHIIQSMRTGILVVENNGRILMTNNAAIELLGKTDKGRMANIEQLSPRLYQRFLDWQHGANQNQQPVQQPQGLPDIQPGFSAIDDPDTLSGHAIGRTLVFLEDATQLAQRFQQVKLASLGRLTASIAHEIRNPLAAINHAGQLLGETAVDESDIKLTNIINTQVKRLNGIIENVLQLSRQNPASPEIINITSWIQQFRNEFISTRQLDEAQIPINIPEPINIFFDPGQLHQVMWNLFSNAIDHSGVDIHDITITVYGGIDETSNLPYIDIIDNGNGISADSIESIFDPFFTTSPTGTGLGLYITKEIIENNRAKIRYITMDTHGTCFRISFRGA